MRPYTTHAWDACALVVGISVPTKLMLAGPAICCTEIDFFVWHRSQISHHHHHHHHHHPPPPPHPHPTPTPTTHPPPPPTPPPRPLLPLTQTQTRLSCSLKESGCICQHKFNLRRTTVYVGYCRRTLIRPSCCHAHLLWFQAGSIHTYIQTS